MSTSQTAFERRERAAEEVFFRQEERLSMLKRLEKMVEQGRLDASVLDQVRKATSPDVHHVQSVEVSPGVFKDVPGETKQREDFVYAHAPGTMPLPRPSETERMKLGIHTDMGPSRWNPDGGASIFSLRDSLAGEEAGAAGRALSAHEVARLARLQAQAGEVPTLFGYSALGQRIADFFLPWRTSLQTRRASRAEIEAEEGAFVRALKQRMVEGRA